MSGGTLDNIGYIETLYYSGGTITSSGENIGEIVYVDGRRMRVPLTRAMWTRALLPPRLSFSTMLIGKMPLCWERR